MTIALLIAGALLTVIIHQVMVKRRGVDRKVHFNLDVISLQKTIRRIQKLLKSQFFKRFD